LRNNSKPGIEQLYKNPKSLENTPKHAKNNNDQSTETKRNSKYQNTSYVSARFLHLVWQAGGVRQLCHWSGAFQTWTATSSFDRVTHHNRYDSANAGRSHRAV